MRHGCLLAGLASPSPVRSVDRCFGASIRARVSKQRKAYYCFALDAFIEKALFGGEGVSFLHLNFKARAAAER